MLLKLGSLHQILTKWFTSCDWLLADTDDWLDDDGSDVGSDGMGAADSDQDVEMVRHCIRYQWTKHNLCCILVNPRAPLTVR